MNQQFSRRDFLKTGGLTLLGGVGATTLSQAVRPAQAAYPNQSDHNHADAMAMAVGEVDHELNGFNPSNILTDFDYGKTSVMEDGRTLREYDVVVINKDIEVVPGIFYPAWTYNGRIPGPTIRATEGDMIRIHLHNGSIHPHSMHFHGFHPSEMDGVPGTPGMIDPGESFPYEFDAEPFGVHLYHCHAFPLARAMPSTIWRGKIL